MSGAAIGLGLASASAFAKDVTIDDTKVFTESISADAAGNLYAGSTKGIVFRAAPGSDKAVAWIRPDGTNKIKMLLGVVAHDASNTLWVCSIPGFGGPPAPGTESAAVAFDLKTGAFKARYVLPGPNATCNDITVGQYGKVYIAETSGGRIFSIAPDAKDVKLEVQDAQLNGIDGIAFTADNILYANNTRANTFFRVNRDGSGNYQSLTKLNLSMDLKGPDGLRLYKGNQLLQAETGNNRIALLTVNGDNVDVKPLGGSFQGPASVTHIGDTAYSVSGMINYMFDPALRDKDPGPFIIKAVPIGGAK
ncbi:MAG: SMP-30/gluconolactonase/LRE family protein [Sphingobium sp.]|nr:SMP-30/gluconolactonase/LRE family protein [Sphingobium sp.]